MAESVDFWFHTTVHEPLGPEEEPDKPTSLFFIMNTVTRYLHGYVIIIVILGGIVGNILSIIIFSRCKTKDVMTVTYFMPLAFADTVGLLYGGIDWLSRGLDEVSHHQYSYRPLHSSEAACKIVRYMYRVATCMSSYIVVLFSIERFFGVWFPLKILSWMSQPKRRNILIGAFLAIALLNIPILYFYRLYYWQSFSACFFHEPAYNELQMYLLIELMDDVLPHTLPCVLILMLSVGIILGVWRARRDAIAVTGKSRIEMKSLVSLLLVALMYLVTTLPYVTVWGYSNYYSTIGKGTFPGMNKQDIAALMQVGFFCTSVSMMNYSFNFLIYAGSLKIYQDELKKMFRSVTLGENGRSTR
jgi:hypothetical protein